MILDRATIIHRLRDHWQAEGQRLHCGDLDLNHHAPWPENLESARAAAVLVPLIERDGGISVLLTERNAGLSSHAGQVAFPGGKIDAGDNGPVGAALREAHEEIGLDPVHVDVVGELDRYLTRTGFLVTPVIGFVRQPFRLEADPAEVSAMFEVPLAFLMDRRNHQIHGMIFHGAKRYFYAMPHDGHFIWGATAGMIVRLYEILTGEPRLMPELEEA